MFKPQTLLALCAALLLTACGGGSGDVLGGGNASGPGGTNTNPNPNTFFPLNIYKQGSNYTPEDVFEGIRFDPYVKAFLIAPVTGFDLAPASNPKITDYDLTVNGKAVHHYQQHAQMQKILGQNIELTTAILIDASSYRNSFDPAKFKAAILKYISDAQSDSDEVIKNQKYTFWVYGNAAYYVLDQPTSDLTVITDELNLVFNNITSFGSGSARNEAIAYAVGGFAGTTASDAVIDMTTALQDIRLNDANKYSDEHHKLGALAISSVVLIGGGASSSNMFNVDEVKAALQSESLIVYDRNAKGEPASEGSGSENSPITYLGKPLFYVALNDEAEAEFKNLTVPVKADENYNFSANLISAQKSAIAARAHKNNRYLVRLSLQESEGTYAVKFSSRTAGFNYSLTSEIKILPQTNYPRYERVEITTAKNEFFASDRIRLSDGVTKLYPATRYTTRTYDSTYYQWYVDGVQRAAASDGSITISAADKGLPVYLENTAFSPALQSSALTIVD